LDCPGRALVCFAELAAVFSVVLLELNRLFLYRFFPGGVGIPIALGMT
jgi:hypothetical protein